MQTPKHFIRDLYADNSLNKAFIMKTDCKPTKVYSDIAAFSTNTKAMQKIMVNHGALHLKPNRQSYENKAKALTNTFGSQVFLDREAKNSNLLSETQNFTANRFSFFDKTPEANQKRFSTPNSQKHGPSRGISQIFCQTPIAKPKFEGSPLKTNDSHYVGEDSRERRSMSSVKRNKYLTVVSRMPVSKKKDSIKLQ